MSIASDPRVRAAQRPASTGFDASGDAQLVSAGSSTAIAASRRAHRWWVYGSLAVISTLVGLRMLASVLAAPLEPVGAGAAPAWQVEVATNGSKPGVVLAYGPEVGIQILRVPAGVGNTSEARVVPARLARGELHLVTLSFNSLRVSSPGAPGSGVVRFSAHSPVVTAFQNSSGAGVRVGW
jgi:hypothetical protein